MDVTFQTTWLRRVFASERDLRRQYGARLARTALQRLIALRGAETLAEATLRPSWRLHQLVGDRDEQFAVDLVHPYRLIFRLNNHPIPLRADGGVDISQVTAITILEVVDYH